MNPISKAVKVTVTMPVSVTYNGRVKNHPPYSPLTKGGHRGVRLGRNGLRNRGRLTYLLFFALLFCLPSSLQARVTGNCSNCHTMHNSQEGQPVAYDFNGTSFTKTATPKGNLLIYNCLGCHSNTGHESTKPGIGAPIVYNTNQPNYGDSQPDNKHIGLAAGNFYWTTETSASGQRRGHSIAGIPHSDLTGWPGSSAPSCGVCHKGIGEGCKSCHLPAHHKGDSSGGWADADDGYYRFLGPLTSASTTHKWGVSGYEDPDWQQTYGSGNHNEYSGQDYDVVYHSISKHCAGCHYYYSGISDPRWCRKFRVGTGPPPFVSPPIYHQATLILYDPTRTSPLSKYKGYVGYNEHPSGPWDYDPKLPIARTNISTGSYPGSQVNHSSTDALMCLTCHRAHASPYNKMLRWDNTLVLADQGTYYGCLGCHSPDPL